MSDVTGTVAKSGKLKGTVATKSTLNGILQAVYGSDGESAYEIALRNGFEGTEAEWLESLKGEKGDKGASGVYVGSGDMPEDCNVQIDPNGVPITLEEIVRQIVLQSNKISSVTLLANLWEGEKSPYSQVVTIAGTTENSKIDLNPTTEQLSIFHTKDIAFVVGNNGGVITVYCIGQKPTNDYTMQVTITEVATNG